jgi:predicted dehydrogenase
MNDTAAARLGVIGAGWWAGQLAEAVGRTGGARLVSCFARGVEQREAFAERHGCRAAGSAEELLADPEVQGVLIVTPHSTHLPLVEAAAAAGKHVFVEKPLTLTLDEARRAIVATERAGVTLQVGHHRRRLGATRRLHGMVDGGALGTLVALEGNLSGPIALGQRAQWRRDPREAPVGGMTSYGVHVVDTLHYLAGPIRRVSAFSRAVADTSGLDDVSVITCEHADGPLSTLTTSTVVPTTQTVGAYGTDAAAWSLQDGARLAFQRRDEKAPATEDVAPVDALAEQMDEFARCALGEARPETGGPEAAAVVAVSEAIERSVASGRAEEVVY